MIGITDIGAVSGTPKSGETLTAGALTPGYAAVNYQWQVSDDGSSGWSNISGETANNYIVDLDKTAVGKFVRVAATGIDSYSGTVYSSALNIWGDYTSANIGTLKYVPAGTFQRDATPANTSAVSGFRMSQHEITRFQFSEIMGADPSNPDYSNGNDNPVQMVTWYDVIAFCNKLSLAEGLTPVYAVNGVDFSTLNYALIPTTSNTDWDVATCNWSANGYRLPTEMEWMWAAMGADLDSRSGAMSGGVNVTGYTKTFAGYDGSNSIANYVWYSTNSSSKTHPAGTKLANEFGLYDMSGNVWEFCWDWDDAYPAGSVSDYRGPGAKTRRVNRGGSWSVSTANVTVSICNETIPYARTNGFGFRVVRR